MSPSLDFYLSHFGLDERPFSLVPDPSFLFWSRIHQRAYAVLEYGLATRAPITLITGEIGAGKTTLLRHLLHEMGDELCVGFVTNVQGDGERGELLRWIMMALDQVVEPNLSYVDIFNQFQMFLIDEYARGRRVVLIFDEAQNLGLKTLEELRMLTNINFNKHEVLQLILVGQPELDQMIRSPSLVQFSQRVVAKFHLSVMDAESVSEYIHHRMRTAGVQKQVFDAEACEIIARAARGVPRLINQLCDFSLVYAATDNLNHVPADTVRSVLQDGVCFADLLILENRVV